MSRSTNRSGGSRSRCRSSRSEERFFRVDIGDGIGVLVVVVDGGVDSVATPVRLPPLLHRQIADLAVAAAVGSASDDPDRLPPLVDDFGEVDLIEVLACKAEVTLALPTFSDLFRSARVADFEDVIVAPVGVLISRGLRSAGSYHRPPHISLISAG